MLIDERKAQNVVKASLEFQRVSSDYQFHYLISFTSGCDVSIIQGLYRILL
jgi:hypothetical protein